MNRVPSGLGAGIASLAAMMATGFSLIACGGSGSPTDLNGNGPETGSINVAAITVNNLDPDGFTVTVTGVGDTSIDPNGSVSIPDVPTGDRILSLGGLAPYCVLDDPEPKRVTVRPGISTPVVFRVTCLAPPEGRILFSESVGGGSWISVMNADGSGRLQLLSRSAWSRTGGRWSPDGSKIAFSAYSEAGSNLDVYVMNPDASEVTRLTIGADDEGRPSWSPDGSRIAYQVGGILPGTAISVMNSDGSNSNQITNHPTHANMWPSWSPDGSMIAYTNFTQPQSLASQDRIVVMQPDGTYLNALTQTAPICGSTGFFSWADFESSWSPDGSRVLFLREGRCPETGEDLRLMVMDANGENVLDLGPATSADWSPDGAQIVYVLEDVFVMNADGSGRVRILESGGPGLGSNYQAVCWGG
ncbi:MAG: hypothetical protein HKO65_02605 [Gemmatimonadetes bacterium]|nr:PD40 domain-containing protein [Gemmatimonadota bacterium]NNM03967.1 hypothetical protein [Gemmatimonadota bacterium]